MDAHPDRMARRTAAALVAPRRRVPHALADAPAHRDPRSAGGSHARDRVRRQPDGDRTLKYGGLVVFLTACRMTGAPPLFEPRAPVETGITFANTLREDDSHYNVIDFDYMYNGGGVAIADVNNDGLPDIYFAGNMVSSRLYLNRGHLRFEDVTEAAGVGTHVWVSGVTVVDINQDGLPDLYLSVGGPDPTGRGNLLFVNQGPGKNGTPRFVEAARRFGIADSGYDTHAAFLDYDRDGDLDLYLLKNALESHNRNRIRPKIGDGQAPSTDRLYRNNGDGTFSDVSRQAGILAEGYGLGVAVTDLNGDGWPDVYVANDFLSNDLVWINNRDGTLTNRAAAYLKHQSFSAMGVDIADVNNDGLVDITVLDMLPPDNLRRKLLFAGETYDQFETSRRLGYEPSTCAIRCSSPTAIPATSPTSTISPSCSR